MSYILRYRNNDGQYFLLIIFIVPRKPTNTWTILSGLSLNCGFQFEKQVVDKDNASVKWLPVKQSDKCCPVSNLLAAFFADIDIR